MSPAQFDPSLSSPGNWSTIATPGTADYRTSDLPMSPPANDPRSAVVSGELEGFPEEIPSQGESLLGDPHIRYPTQPPTEQAPPQVPPQPFEPVSVLPPGVVSPIVGTHPTPPIDPAVNTTPQPPIQSYQQFSQPTRPPPIPVSQPSPHMIRNNAPPPPAAPAPPPQLTPKQIAQAQKHCRYAISALDYEDFERARQDLLDALTIIGS